MQYFLNDTVTGPYSGNTFGRKGDVVTLISDHGNVSIVEMNGNRFTTSTLKLSKKEVEQDPAGTQIEKEETPAYIKPGRNKKSVTNQSNNIQSLF